MSRNEKILRLARLAKQVGNKGRGFNGGTLHVPVKELTELELAADDVIKDQSWDKNSSDHPVQGHSGHSSDAERIRSQCLQGG